MKKTSASVYGRRALSARAFRAYVESAARFAVDAEPCAEARDGLPHAAPTATALRRSAALLRFCDEVIEWTSPRLRYVSYGTVCVEVSAFVRRYRNSCPS